MQDLIAQGDAPIGSTVPNQLSNEKLWDLDVDDDLWMDLAQDGQYQDDDAPRWLYDEPTKRGIRAMLDLQRSEEELERLGHERNVMYTWIREQEKQLQLASHIAQGTHPILLPFSYSDSTNYKAIPTSFTRLNCAVRTSFVPVGLGTSTLIQALVRTHSQKVCLPRWNPACQLVGPHQRHQVITITRTMQGSCGMR
jgi:hypothetical protein